MRLEIDVMLDYQLAEPADVLLQIEVAQMADQRLVGDNMTANSSEPLRSAAGGDEIGRRSWVLGQGPLHVVYSALVDIDRPAAIDIAGLEATDPRMLPAEVIPYLLPSRYVECERFASFVKREFGAYPGGAMVATMCDWIADRVDYVSGSSNGDTTASATFVRRQGVCRDFAHLLAAFARAAEIPARVVSAYAPDVFPQDFHAVVELWLDDEWRLIDPTGMAATNEIARIVVGRDAADIAFMTVFGTAEMMAQTVKVRRLD